MKKQETFTFSIYQDGELRKELTQQTNDANTFGWLLRNQGQSVEWALKYGGWTVIITNEHTGEKTNY